MAAPPALDLSRDVLDASVAADTLRDDLKRLFGHGDFRHGQREIVEAALAGRDTLAVLPTGGGKSLTFQLPAMLVPGATLVLSPLIALMKDQAENLPPAVAAQSTIINSSLEPGEVQRRLALVRAGRIKMIYAAPERLRQPPFLHALRRADVSLLVVDEAHCISQWGHDFRPDYRAVGRAVEALNPRTVLAVTATATPDVADDIERQLGRTLHRIVRPTYRNNLFLGCVRVQGEDDKLWTTLDLCKNTPGAGLVYAGSREKCEKLARMLRRQGVAAGFYHAGLPPDERAAAQDRFMSGEVRVMAATVAFGMGVDKSDIRFLVHFHPSRTLENYYQEAGRAGRDGDPSTCVLLHSAADAASTSRHLKEDTLTLNDIRAVYNAVKGAVGKGAGPVAFEAVAEASGGEEGMVRATLPLLEEAGLLIRHTDLPRRLALYPDFTREADGGGDAPPEWEAFSRAIRRGGDFDPLYLATETGVPLPQVEEAALRLQDAGLLSCRALGREMQFEILPPPPDTKERMQATLTHRAKGQRERADAMLAYAKDNKCRHGAIARYFGDRWPHRTCGACDVCTGEKFSIRTGPTNARGDEAEAAEATAPEEAPLAALRLVYDLSCGNYPFYLGRAGLMRALRGTPDAPIKPNRTPQYGRLAAYKKAEIERLIDALVDGELLRRDDNDEFRRLYLTDAGLEAVRAGEAFVEWRLSAPASTSGGRSGSGGGTKTAAEPAETGDADPALLADLKAWRTGLALADNVPPYVVFQDKVLVGIAATKPANEFDLLAINGVGPAKAARYGDAVLELVRKHDGGGDA